MDHQAHPNEPSPPDQSELAPKEDHGGLKHWGLMLLCCAPMIAIALLIAFGLWSW